MGRVSNLFIGKKRGMAKLEYDKIQLKENFGIINDIHATEGRHQVSILSKRSIDKFKANDLTLGTFEANIIVEDIDLFDLPINTKVKFGKEVILEITQIGKKDVLIEDHYSTMYHEGIFAKVIHGGQIKKNDFIEVI
jgi:MOSC domain-containing protein YiiM